MENYINPEALKFMILNEGISLSLAALRFDTDEDRVTRILFNAKPSKGDLNKAVELYKEGISLLAACITTRVSPNALAAELKSRRTIKHRFCERSFAVWGGSGRAQISSGSFYAPKIMYD